MANVQHVKLYPDVLPINVQQLIRHVLVVPLTTLYQQEDALLSHVLPTNGAQVQHVITAQL